MYSIRLMWVPSHSYIGVLPHPLIADSQSMAIVCPALLTTRLASLGWSPMYFILKHYACQFMARVTCVIVVKQGCRNDSHPTEA